MKLLNMIEGARAYATSMLALAGGFGFSGGCDGSGTQIANATAFTIRPPASVAMPPLTAKKSPAAAATLCASAP